MTHHFWFILASTTANLCSNECVWTLFKGKSSVLHPVSERGDTSFVQLLLGYKADTNARNQVEKMVFFFFSPTRFPALFYICVRYFQDQEAPLHLAVKNNHIPVIHCLLTAGCDINATDKVPAAQHSSETVGQTLYILSVCVCVSRPMLLPIRGPRLLCTSPQNRPRLMS